jgi:hypothetical protein
MVFSALWKKRLFGVSLASIGAVLAVVAYFAVG